jgi:gamma-glutamyltranspeptidase / glutathione hydrolase
MPTPFPNPHADRKPGFVHRPPVMGTRHMVSAGHYLAAQAGLQILEAGGNAIDAGVAAGIALGVLQSDIVNVAGVAPILVRLAATKEVVSIAGLGTWPRAVTPDFFVKNHGGRIPHGLLRSVVPAAPDAWITALERYGTMAFGDVAAAATRFARDGFPLHQLMAEIVAGAADKYARWPSSAAIYLPGGKPPRAGEIFRQSDLGASLQYMADEERAARGKGRAAGLAAARDAFYRGDIARKIVAYHKAEGGLMTAEDLAGYRSEVEKPVHVSYRGIDVYMCPPWCQGPVLGQFLAMIDGVDVAALGHNTPAYIHLLTEVMKLGFADRERWYGDPRFVDVPLARLLSRDYADARRRSIDARRAGPALPPPGSPVESGVAAGSLDTSYVAVVDRWGNAFSATPSDTSSDTPVIPGTGLCPSSRGSQNWADPAHTSSVAPGKRPRLTPNPAMAIAEGRFVMPFGTPGGDVQCQAMLQTLLNMTSFGMHAQEAVEAPRFSTYSFADSFEPHATFPNRLMLEDRIAGATGDALQAMGHEVQRWPDWTWKAGAMCVVQHDLVRGTLTGAADPRRQAYAVGW